MWSWPVSTRLFLNELREPVSGQDSAGCHQFPSPQSWALHFDVFRPWGENRWERIPLSFCLWCLTDVIYSIGPDSSYLPPSLAFRPTTTGTPLKAVVARALAGRTSPHVRRPELPRGFCHMLCAPWQVIFLLCRTEVIYPTLPVSQCYDIGRLRWNYDCESSIWNIEHIHLCIWENEGILDSGMYYNSSRKYWLLECVWLMENQQAMNVRHLKLFMIAMLELKVKNIYI